ELEPTAHAECGGTACDAAALVGQLERALDERLRLVDLETCDVHEGEALNDEHLEVLALRCASSLQRRLRPPLVLVRVAEPAGDLRQDPQRLEEDPRRLAV